MLPAIVVPLAQKICVNPCLRRSAYYWPVSQRSRLITKPRQECQGSIDISFLTHSRWAGQLWKVKVSNVKCPQSLWCPKIQDTHTHWQSKLTFSTAHIWSCTVMDWWTLTPSDILTDCIYPDNYSLCIICTNNHLIISHPRVKSVLFRLHPPVISSFIQTLVTFETLIRT